MKITAPKQELLRIVEHAKSIADPKATMPMLACVLIDATRRNVDVTATDLYLSYCAAIAGDAVEIEAKGKVAIPARDLFDRLKAMPEGPVVLAVDGKTATLKSAATARRFSMRRVDGEDFPLLPEPEGKPASILGSTLARAIEAIRFAVSTDTTRAALNSGLLEWQGRRLRMVATDGHRLSTIEIETEPAPDMRMLISLPALGELARIAEGADELELLVGRANGFARTGATLFGWKLVDAQFPPYQQVVPSRTERELVVGRAALADALKAVSVASNDRTGSVRFEIGPGKLTIKAESPEAGDGADEIDIEYRDAPLTIGVNAKYLLDVLGVIGSDEVRIGFGGGLDPMLVRPGKDAEGETYRAVVMPLRVN